MRNVFDQYKQWENRITHALLTALHEDRNLLAAFLREFAHSAPPPGKSVHVLSQCLPGEDQASEEENEKRGIPDGWIHNDEDWCVVIESKVLVRISADQMRRHRAIAERRGFTAVHAVAITPKSLTAPLPDVACCTWQDVYVWLRSRAMQSAWAARAAEYLEVAEAKLISEGLLREGALTRFAGIPFNASNPFNYREAKRLIRVALAELRNDPDLRSSLRIDSVREGRSAISQEEGRVWDFIWLSCAGSAQGFTDFPHLTLGIHSDAVVAMVTVPHGVNGTVRRRIRDLGEAGFRDLVSGVLANMAPLLARCSGASPRMQGVQRRYASQKGPIFVDAEINFDLRTAIPDSGDPKLQPRWLDAAYGSFASKHGSNYQIQIGVRFPYKHCPDLAKPAALNLIRDGWLACRPLVELAF